MLADAIVGPPPPIWSERVSGNRAGYDCWIMYAWKWIYFFAVCPSRKSGRILNVVVLALAGGTLPFLSPSLGRIFSIQLNVYSSKVEQNIYTWPNSERRFSLTVLLWHWTKLNLSSRLMSATEWDSPTLINFAVSWRNLWLLSRVIANTYTRNCNMLRRKRNWAKYLPSWHLNQQRTERNRETSHKRRSKRKVPPPSEILNAI